MSITFIIRFLILKNIVFLMFLVGILLKVIILNMLDKTYKASKYTRNRDFQK